jgi:cytochrome c-type biogenesis protein
MALTSALWLGLLTSVSPCPLATNIAAISYVGKSVASPRRVFLAGALYSLGRAFVYGVLGLVLVSSILSTPRVSFLLQKYMNQLLGPLLIVVGLVLLEVVSLNVNRFSIGDGLQKRAASWGMSGSFLLGALFALSFCPFSAALFFGSLLSLAVKNESQFAIPIIYGIGTGLPVLLFAGAIAASANWVGRAFNGITALEKWARRITAVVFIGVGLYCSYIEFV